MGSKWIPTKEPQSWAFLRVLSLLWSGLVLVSSCSTIRGGASEKETTVYGLRTPCKWSIDAHFDLSSSRPFRFCPKNSASGRLKPRRRSSASESESSPAPEAWDVCLFRVHYLLQLSEDERHVRVDPDARCVEVPLEHAVGAGERATLDEVDGSVPAADVVRGARTIPDDLSPSFLFWYRGRDQACS